MAEKGKAGGGPSTVAVAIVVLLLTVVAAGAGVAVGALLSSPPSLPAAKSADQTEPAVAEHKTTDAGEAATHSDAPAAAEPAASTVVPFPPILTNLADPPTTWIRLEGAVLVQKESEPPQDLLVERASEQIVAYLRTVRLAQIEGPSGFLHLREDLDDVVSTLSEGQVRAVLINSMVLE